jgi:hypothetical protein
MASSGVVERPWLTSQMGPTCGPALSLFPFSLFAKQAWKKNSVSITDEPEIIPSIALYWHLLDHGRKQGKWTPPLANEIQGIG